MRDGEIDKVINKISALPEADKLTLENKAEVETAREAYNGLTEEQQKLVTNLNKLETAEAKIKELTELKVLRVKDIPKYVVVKPDPSVSNFGVALYLQNLQAFIVSDAANEFKGLDKFTNLDKNSVLIMTLENGEQTELPYDADMEAYFEMLQGNYTIEQLENAVLTVKQNKSNKSTVYQSMVNRAFI